MNIFPIQKINISTSARTIFRRSLETIATVAVVVGVLSGLQLKSGIVSSQAQQQQILVQDEQATIAAVRKTRPAVVSIVITKKVVVNQPSRIIIPNDFFNDPFFQIRPQVVPSAPKEETREVGSGTGFIIDAGKGLIVTNKHVANDRTATYTVYLNDGRSFPATVTGLDPLNDIAVLKINASNLTAVTLGNSDAIEIGQTVLAIGNSLGRYQNTVTKGVISGLGRSVTASDNRGRPEELSDIIQTDAAINPGNSGGPLVNIKGEVVAVNTAVDLQGQSIGFAIPINTAKYAIASIQKNGAVVRPWLGVRFVMITPEIQKLLNLSVKEGALLQPGQSVSEAAVIEGSPAFEAGIRQSDIITDVDGQKLKTSQDLQKIIARHRVGDTIPAKVIRGSSSFTAQIKLRAAPTQ